MSSSPRLDPREGGHPFGRASGKMVILLNMQREDGRYLVIPLDVPKEDMFISFGVPREDGRYL